MASRHNFLNAYIVFPKTVNRGFNFHFNDPYDYLL